MGKVSEKPYLTAREVACVTQVPLAHVRRLISSGLLGECVKIQKGGRMIIKDALVAVKLAHETAGILTKEARRDLARNLIANPERTVVRLGIVSLDLRAAKSSIKRGIASLDRAIKMVKIDKGIRGGDPCFSGTRVQVHDVAGMLAGVNQIRELLDHYPSLTEKQLRAAPIYAEAYPLRARPRRETRLPGHRLTYAVTYPYEETSSRTST